MEAASNYLIKAVISNGMIQMAQEQQLGLLYSQENFMVQLLLDHFRLQVENDMVVFSSL